MTETTSRLALPLIMAGQAQKEITHNEALALIDLGVGAAAQQAGLNTPPVAPAPGQCWIVGDAPTGSWTGQARALAGWPDAGWRFVPASAGLTVWLVDQQLWAVCDGSAWVVGDQRCARVLIGGQAVLGARQPAVAAPTGGTVVDAEARAAITALTARLVAHGLIAA